MLVNIHSMYKYRGEFVKHENKNEQNKQQEFFAVLQTRGVNLSHFRTTVLESHGDKFKVHFSVISEPKRGKKQKGADIGD